LFVIKKINNNNNNKRVDTGQKTARKREREKRVSGKYNIRLIHVLGIHHLVINIIFRYEILSVNIYLFNSLIKHCKCTLLGIYI